MARSARRGRHRLVREAAAARHETEQEEGLIGVLYDSDVIIEILRGRARILEAAALLEGGGVPTYCTPISVAEVNAGIRPGEETSTEAFFAARGEVVLDNRVGRRAGVYLARYARTDGVEIADALVAAAAATSGLRLWTLNRKQYPMPDVTFHEV